MLPVMFSFRHAFSEVHRPVAEKLCHMIGNWLNFIIQVQKIMGQNMQNFGRFYTTSETTQDIRNRKA